MQTLIACYAVGGNPKGLKLGIVNHEVESYKDCFNSSLITTIAKEDSCTLNKVSCRFMNEIDDSFMEKVFYEHFDEAFADAKKGKIIAIIEFSANFTESLWEVYSYGNAALDSSIEYSRIDIFMDHTSYQLKYLAEKHFYEAYDRFVKELLKDCNIDERKGQLPIRFHDAIYGDKDAEFILTMLPPFILL